MIGIRARLGRDVELARQHRAPHARALIAAVLVPTVACLMGAASHCARNIQSEKSGRFRPRRPHCRFAH
jgi:hypothetical protein